VPPHWQTKFTRLSRTTNFYGPRKKTKAVVGAVSNRDELGLANSIIVVANHPTRH